MKAVILEASRSCTSAWITIGDARRVCVSGLQGGRDQVYITFLNGTRPLTIHQDGTYDLPEGAEKLRARVHIIDDTERLNVDLE